MTEMGPAASGPSWLACRKSVAPSAPPIPEGVAGVDVSAELLNNLWLCPVILGAALVQQVQLAGAQRPGTMTFSIAGGRRDL